MEEKPVAVRAGGGQPGQKGWLSRMDDMAELRGSGVKTLWQFVKFMVVSFGVALIQLVLANLLPYIFDNMTAVLPGILQSVFNPEAMFDRSTASGAADWGNYVVNGAVTWGFVLPFFLSNAIANTVGYIENKKRTFKSDAPAYCFAIYIALLAALILFSTWLQSIVYGWINGMDVSALSSLARTIASMAAGSVQMLVLFPMEKFVLLKEKKE